MRSRAVVIVAGLAAVALACAGVLGLRPGRAPVFAHRAHVLAVVRT